MVSVQLLFSLNNVKYRLHKFGIIKVFWRLIDESVPRPALAVADAVKIYKLLTERNLDVERDIMMRQKLPVGSWGKPYGHKAFKYEFRVSK